MTLQEIFTQNPNIVINTDIDGILSGLILVKCCDCQIVGFTNSKDKVWLDPKHNDLYGNVYVDMFVADKRAICIDQHIVAVNDAHMQSIRNRNNIHSPQSDDKGNLRVFSTEGFKNKYPFGTVHYLIARLESEKNITIDLPEITKRVPRQKFTIGDLILRADDAMMSSLFNYPKNAAFWWNWLNDKYPDGSIATLQTYLKTLQCTITNKDKGEKLKKKIKKYFSDFNCKTGDGGFKEITDGTGVLKPHIYNYIQAIAKLLEVTNVTIPQQYIVHTGTYCRTRWLDIFANDLIQNGKICGHTVFSYAFIYGPDNDSLTNFSFTIDMV